MSNNCKKTNQCLPLMSDGRHVTDYRPSCYVHDLIQKQNGIHSSYDLRLFMINNARRLMDVNRQYYLDKNECTCCPYFHPDPNGQDAFWVKYQKNIGYRM